MITGYECYKYYLGVKLHFTSDKYDVIAAGGKVNAGPGAYNRRKDKSFFERLAQKFEHPRYAIRYFVANFAYGHDNVVYEPQVSQDLVTNWIKVKESLSRVFENDLDIIHNDAMKNKINQTEIFHCTQNGICSIIKLYKIGKINIETVNIILKYNPQLIFEWKQHPQVKLLYLQDLLRIEKLTPFIKVSDRCEEVWNNFIQEHDYHV